MFSKCEVGGAIAPIRKSSGYTGVAGLRDIRSQMRLGSGSVWGGSGVWSSTRSSTSIHMYI